MAADSGRLRSDQAAQACMTCKFRKKKCNKSLPSCGYCIRKQLACSYSPVTTYKESNITPNRGARPPLKSISSAIIVSAKLSPDQGEAETHCEQVYIQVHGVIRATGQFVDDISARYFYGFHRHLPIVSRTRFNNNLVSGKAAPTADFSVLLLAMCLITHAPALGYHAGQAAASSIEQKSIYLTTRSLFAQVQASCTPSIPLIQAGLLMAVYEYIQGWPDDSFVTISGIARMAYAIRMHTRDRGQIQMAHVYGHNANMGPPQQAEEEANTWWGIVIFERIFYSEVAVLDQPLLTDFPGGHSRLPIDPEIFDHLDILDAGTVPNIPISCLTSPNIGGFSRTAQATCLLDQVFKSIDTLDIDSRFLQLEMLDTNIQAFLSLVMPQCQGQSGVFCESMNIAIRALFILHCHILNQHPQTVRASFKSLDEWQKRSQDALDTVTKMVIDIANNLIAPSPANTKTRLIDGMPPMYPYIARAALLHIKSRIQMEDIDWMRGAENTARISLDKYSQRWGLTED